MKYIKKIIFNANEFNIDLNYAKLDNVNEFTNVQKINLIPTIYYYLQFNNNSEKGNHVIYYS